MLTAAQRYRRRYYLANKDRELAGNSTYRKDNAETIKAYTRDVYLRNRRERLNRQKRYYKRNRRERLAYAKRYARLNREALSEKATAYRRRNLLAIRMRDRQRSKERYKDPEKKRKILAYFRSRRRELRLRLRERCSRVRLLFGGKCSACGYSEFMEILHLDHKYGFSGRCESSRRSTSDRIYGALRDPDKFQLLCPNCHAIKTSLQKQNGMTTRSSRRYWKERLAIIKAFGSACQKCGYSKNVLAFQFDHKVPLLGKPRNPAIIEVPKNPGGFNLLCSNCHARKTLKEIMKD